MRPKAGFTLLEMMVALVVASLVVAIAARVHSALLDAGARIEAAREAVDRAANGRRLLSGLLGGVEIGSPASRFEGSARRAVFSAWWNDEQGRWSRARCGLELDQSRLVLHLGSARAVVLADSLVAGAIDYLSEPGERSPWLRAFESQLLVPAALRLRLQRGEQVDTLLFMIWSRG
jgi:prepilin-type N-terminal cleavage/methylation domain-containing protein